MGFIVQLFNYSLIHLRQKRIHSLEGSSNGIARSVDPSVSMHFAAECTLSTRKRKSNCRSVGCSIDSYHASKSPFVGSGNWFASDRSRPSQCFNGVRTYRPVSMKLSDWTVWSLELFDCESLFISHLEEHFSCCFFPFFVTITFRTFKM